jgi:hypothetical protein
MWLLPAEYYASILAAVAWAFWAGWVVYYARLCWRAAKSPSGAVLRFVFAFVVCFHKLWPAEFEPERRRAFFAMLAVFVLGVVFRATGITDAT